MIAIVLSSFVLALLAPRLARLWDKRAGVVFAVLPGLHFAFLVAGAGTIARGGEWVERVQWVPSLGITFSFFGDGLSLIFSLLISGIGALIFAYAGAYMRGDRHLPRMYAFLALFMGSMQGVVFADNLVTLLVFWELTSVSSYLLIGYSHSEESSRRAALQALLVTGGGGLALMAGLILLGIAAGTYELSEINLRGEQIQEHGAYLAIVILVLAGCFTKSAQFPFHFWLPNAMAAPTPISAYLHSSTMVKAGIYLMARLTPALGDTPVWQYALMIAGGLTAVVASWLALQQTVFKPLLAYTTVSALGLITLCLGLGTPIAVKAALAFLVVHALYKAALFLVAGSVDHEAGEKDTARLGGLRKHMPLTAAGALLAGLSMAGIPPMLGFFGKEVMYEAAVKGTLTAAVVLASVTVFANGVNIYAALTAAYRPFWGKRRETPKDPHDGPISLWAGPALLGVLGLAFGVFPHILGHTILEPGITAAYGAPYETEWKLWHGFNLPLLLSGVTILLGLLLYMCRGLLHRIGGSLRILGKIGPEAAYDQLLAGMQALAGAQTKLLQNGYLRIYLMIVFLTILALPGWELLSDYNGAIPTNVLIPQIYEVSLALLIVVSTGIVVTATSRLVAVAALGALGYSVAVIFVLFGAPDVAMTQFIIETLMVIIMLLVLHHLPKFRGYSSPRGRIRDMLIAVLAGLFMSFLVIVALTVQDHDAVSQYYAENAVPKGHGRNVVNVILVDFRALDTLGEITVLVIAALGAASLLKLQTKEGDAP